MRLDLSCTETRLLVAPTRKCVCNMLLLENVATTRKCVCNKNVCVYEIRYSQKYTRKCTCN